MKYGKSDRGPENRIRKSHSGVPEEEARRNETDATVTGFLEVMKSRPAEPGSMARLKHHM